MTPLRMSQAVILKTEDSTLHAVGERRHLMPWIPRRGESISWAYHVVRDGQCQERSLTLFVSLVTHEVGIGGEVQIALLMEPFVETEQDAFEARILMLQSTGFAVTLEADQ